MGEAERRPLAGRLNAVEQALRGRRTVEHALGWWSQAPRAPGAAIVPTARLKAPEGAIDGGQARAQALREQQVQGNDPEVLDQRLQP